MTEHPCKGLSKIQVEVFERIAINEPHMASENTINALLRRGLIEPTEPKIIQSRFGDIRVKQYLVPLPLHMQWCEWASEQPALTEGKQE